MRQLSATLAAFGALTLSGCVSAGASADDPPQPTATVTVTPEPATVTFTPQPELEEVEVVPQECLDTIVHANERSREFDELVDVFMEGLQAADERDAARLQAMSLDLEDLLDRAESSGESYKTEALECAGIARDNGQDIPDELYE